MKSSTFRNELIQAINTYFDGNGISRWANCEMVIKLIVTGVWWSASLLLIFVYGNSPVSFFFLYGLHLISHLFILINIAHDANHFAILKNRKGFFSKALTYSFDLCGISSYMWRLFHNHQHHSAINIEGEDDGLVTRGLLRYTNNQNHRFIHRFQHYYAFIVYSLFSLDYIFVKDFEGFFFPFLNGLKGRKHQPVEYVKLVGLKLLYVGYMIALPIVLLGYAVGFVLAVFIAWHLLIGLIAAIVIQVEHPLRENEFPASKNDYSHFMYHVFATTSDHSPDSMIARMFYGGLNLHVIHHLAPRVCHTHYRGLTMVIEPIARKHGVNYKQNKSIFHAIREHYGHLKNLSVANQAT